jgi:hypothetical protein
LDPELSPSSEKAWSNFLEHPHRRSTSGPEETKPDLQYRYFLDVAAADWLMAISRFQQSYMTTESQL